MLNQNQKYNRMRTKKTVQNSVSLTLAGAILLASCSPTQIGMVDNMLVPNLNEDSVPETRAMGLDMEKILDPCLIPISRDDIDLLCFSINLIENILKDSTVATEFVENPTSYMEKCGFLYKGNIDVAILQIAIASSDLVVRETIKNQDVNGFINICRQRGILSLPSGFQDFDSNYLMVNEENLIEYLTKNGYSLSFIDALKNDNDNDVIAVKSAIVAFLVLVVAVAVAPVIAIPGLPVNQHYNIDDIEISPLSLWLYNASAENLYVPIPEWIDSIYRDIETILLAQSSRYATDEHYRADVEKIVKINLLKSII